MAMYNVFVLYKQNTDRSMPSKDFIIDLVESLALDDVPVLPAVGPGGDPGAGHNIYHLLGSRLRHCAVYKTRGIKKKKQVLVFRLQLWHP